MILYFLALLCQIMGYLIIARSITTWFPNSRNNPIVIILYQITDPIMKPLTKYVPKLGMIDLSPLVGVLIVFALARFLISLS